MKRCGIFVLFNEQGIVEGYIEELLKSVDEVLDRLIIVINGKLLDNEKLKLNKYSDCIIQRENVGFDGGAYKDIFTVFFRYEDWKQWDELLLVNDTFYGPFLPWSDIFMVMQERKCDFWGLSSHARGISALFDGEVIAHHIQSYFIVIKKEMFLHRMFHQFWEDLEYSLTFKEAVKYFEINFTEYFSKLGFKYESWIEVKKEQLHIEHYQYLNDMETWITKLNFPVFKRKMYKLQYYLSLKRIFQFIDKVTNYPIDVIQEDIYLRSVEGKIEPYNPENIKQFCDQYDEIYLFGKGEYARNIEQYLIDNGKSICGYIVSKVRKTEDRVFRLDEFEVKPYQGVIVALNQKNLEEVKELIEKKIASEQLIVPIYE